MTWGVLLGAQECLKRLAEGVDNEADGAQALVVEHVAAVKDEGGLAHAGVDALKVQAGELVPLRDDAQRMGPRACLHMGRQSAGKASHCTPALQHLPSPDNCPVRDEHVSASSAVRGATGAKTQLPQRSFTLGCPLMEDGPSSVRELLGMGDAPGGVAAGGDALLNLAAAEGHLGAVGQHGVVPLELGRRQVPACTAAAPSA